MNLSFIFRYSNAFLGQDDSIPVLTEKRFLAQIRALDQIILGVFHVELGFNPPSAQNFAVQNLLYEFHLPLPYQ